MPHVAGMPGLDDESVSSLRALKRWNSISRLACEAAEDPNTIQAGTRRTDPSRPW